MFNNLRKILIGFSVLIALLLIGRAVFHRLHQAKILAEQTEALNTQPVTLVTPVKAPETRDLDLPANLAAWYEAPIYAQVSGYVKMWYVDIGAHVKAGQILAEINTPSLDAEYAAAKAHYDVISARYRLAQITAQRWKALEGTQAVSRQEVDVQAANASAQQAELEAAQHEVERFEALEAFKKIKAPFDGIITARHVNVGDYVNGDGGNVNSRGATVSLYSVADVHKIRAYVSIPQDYATGPSAGVKADFTSPQYPGSIFSGQFLASANAFDKATRTVLNQFLLENKDGRLWPNAYMTAHLSVPRLKDTYLLPSGALIFRGSGMQVATVENNRVKIKSVQVGADFGLKAEILAGLNGTEKIVANPSVDILDGDSVRIVPPTRGYDDAQKGKSS